jgi:transcriptional regulator with PAS, ATPase and Fis domain
MIAELIHRMGPRAGGPFVVVDGGALSPSLIESELFGHERGSFTGASERRLGAFETAQGGTVFLDEIGELPLELQPKLLRALEERVVRRLGSSQTVRLDLQIIAATNRNLLQAVREGRFRADLYYRLEALRLTIPPLRERREDILPLASLFIDEFAKGRARFSEAVAACLDRYPWPGNVRELRNAMERAVLLSRSELILPEHLPTRVREQASGASLVSSEEAQRLEEVERKAILQVLRKHQFNRTETAKALGISRRALIYKLQRFRKLGYEIDAV